MQITIDLPSDLEEGLVRQAAQSQIPLQTLILRALHREVQRPHVSTPQWPDAVLSYAGVSDFPAFEAYRDELFPPNEAELL